MHEPKFNPAMLVVARESRGLTQTELAKQMAEQGERIQQGVLSRIESGQLSPSSSQQRAFQVILRYPEGFFFQRDAVYQFGSSTFYHRKQQSLQAGLLRSIQARVNIHRFHVMRLMRATDLDQRCRFRAIDPAEHQNQIREIAQLIRATWRMPSGPVQSVTRYIEAAGGVVIRFDFGTSRLSGISEWIPPAPPVFFLNDNADVSGERDRYTLAHELGHTIMHHLPTPAMEEQANAFAGEFLLPEKEFRRQIRTPLRLAELVEMKKYWQVSMAAIVQHAYVLGAINERQRQYLFVQLAQRGYRTKEPFGVPPERPTLLQEIIRAHVRELGYTSESLASMLNMQPDEFRAWYPPEDGRLLLVKNSR